MATPKKDPKDLLPVGRKTKYNAELQANADTYITKLEELGHIIPSRVGLCCFLGIHKSTSIDWEQKYPAFSDTIKDIEALQEHLTLNGGLSGKLNPTITKLVLSNHGYHEKAQTDVVSSDGSMSPKGIDSSKLSTEALAEIMRAADENTTD